MKDLKITNADIIELKKEFNELATTCNERYYSYIVNQDEEYKAFESERVKKQLSDAKKNDIDLTSPAILSAQIEAGKRKAQKEYGDLMASKNRKCLHELKEINRLISLFDSMYNINDPRAYTIIRAVISQSLTVLRLERYIANDGPIVRKIDRDGNISADISLLEDAKRRFNESTIKAVEQLDKIFEGIKTNVNFEGEITVKQLLDSILVNTEDNPD